MFGMLQIKKLVTKHSPAYSLEPELSRDTIEGCQVRFLFVISLDDIKIDRTE